MPDNETLTMVAELLPTPNGIIMDVVLNRGSNAGVKVGDKYLVYGLGKEIIDPATKESLGILELPRGRGEVVSVQETICILRSIEKKPTSQPRKTIRTNVGGYAMFNSGTTIEEQDFPLNEYDRVQVGDLARKISK